MLVRKAGHGGEGAAYNNPAIADSPESIDVIVGDRSLDTDVVRTAARVEARDIGLRQSSDLGEVAGDDDFLVGLNENCPDDAVRRRVKAGVDCSIGVETDEIVGGEWVAIGIVAV